MAKFQKEFKKLTELLHNSTNVSNSPRIYVYKTPPYLFYCLACPNTYAFDEALSFCVRIHEEVNVTYEEAKSLCETNGDRLVVTETANKVAFIRDLIIKQTNGKRGKAG